MLGEGYTYAGIADTDTQPDTLQNVFYILGEVGTYPYFGNIVHSGGLGIAKWDGTQWVYENVQLALSSGTTPSQDTTPATSAQEVTITIVKADVYNEVAKITSYVGAKKIGADADSYERIFTTDDDMQMLERFWHEACDATTTQLREFLSEVSELGDSFRADLTNDYEITLGMSERFDQNLANAISKDLFGFFVCYILAQWYMMTNVEDAEAQAKKAEGIMTNVMDKIYRVKPPTY